MNLEHCCDPLRRWYVVMERAWALESYPLISLLLWNIYLTSMSYSCFIGRMQAIIFSSALLWNFV